MATPAEHFEEALGHYRAGRGTLAEQSCREVLQANPRHAHALNLLGILAREAGNSTRALDLIGQAIAIEPSRPAFHRNQGEIYRALGREPEAGTSFARALWLQPDSASAHTAMGVWLFAQGAFAEAEDCFRQALRLGKDDAATLNNLGATLFHRGMLAEARRSFERAVAQNPALAEAQAGLRDVLARQAKPELALAPPSPVPAAELSAELRLRLALMLPVIYQSVDDLQRARARLESKLARLRDEDLRFHDQDPTSYAPQCYLAYQGLNDRDLQQTLAGIYTKAAGWLHYVAPHCVPAAVSSPPAGRPIRIGFLSLFFLNHTIGKLNVGFIRNLSRIHFRVVLLRLPGPADELATAIQESADVVVNLPRDLASARHLIAEQQLDILFYTDIGIDPFTYLLAFARLAPVQCVTWGHPVTTGIPTIDYFLSSAHLDLPEADAHYSERLVRLTDLNTYYYELRPATPAQPRAAFGLPEDGHLYVCTQSLFKFHPEFDEILGRILRTDPEGRLVLIDCPHPNWTRLLIERLRQAYPDVAGRIVVLPRLSMDGFLHLQALADVLLDTIHFGGGNTSLEAFTVGTPIVTLPGRFLRSRITYACYAQMGILDCVAVDPDDYVRIAVRLGTDPTERQRVRARILDRKHLLYENRAAVRELEEFLLAAVLRSGQ
jgi:predicted O-linked N-acetylglucosamine transferase (SPINDLY family)